MMRKSIDYFLKSFMAGIMISIGCVINLSCDNRYVGSLLFCIGLITILLFKLNLYTGKVCYIVKNKPKYIIDVLISFLGNAVGCTVMGLLFPIAEKQMCSAKLEFSLPTVLLKSILCGVMICVAVESYNKFGTLVPTFFCIPTFILSGYIHVVADTFYFVSAGVFNFSVVKYLLIAAIGNAVGGMLSLLLLSKANIDIDNDNDKK